MKRLIGLVGLGLVLGAAAAREPDDQTPDVKEIMSKANKPTGIYFNLKKDLEDEEPNWQDIQEQTKELAQLAAQLGKATPPKGDKASWTRLTKAYADNAKALAAAAARMDKKGTLAAHARLGGNTCTSCHKVHKGN
jgi:hypothetical protein